MGCKEIWGEACQGNSETKETGMKMTRATNSTTRDIRQPYAIIGFKPKTANSATLANLHMEKRTLDKNPNKLWVMVIAEEVAEEDLLEVEVVIEVVIEVVEEADSILEEEEDKPTITTLWHRTLVFVTCLLRQGIASSEILANLPIPITHK